MCGRKNEDHGMVCENVEPFKGHVNGFEIQNRIFILSAPLILKF